MTVRWKLSGKVLVACNCDWGCPCNFNALPKLKEALFAIQSREPNRIPASFFPKESSSIEALLAPLSASGSRGTSNTTTPASTSHSVRSSIREVRNIPLLAEGNAIRAGRVLVSRPVACRPAFGPE